MLLAALADGKRTASRGEAKETATTHPESAFGWGPTWV